MKRLASFLIGLVVAYPLSSCAVGNTIHRDALVTNPEPQKPFHHFSKSPGQRVLGYTTRDNAHYAFDGRAWIEADSMVFDRPAKNQGMEATQPAVRRRVALSDLASVDAAEVSALHTAVFVVGMTALAAGIYTVGSLAAWSSSGGVWW